MGVFFFNIIFKKKGIDKICWKMKLNYVLIVLIIRWDGVFYVLFRN